MFFLVFFGVFWAAFGECIYESNLYNYYIVDMTLLCLWRMLLHYRK